MHGNELSLFSSCVGCLNLVITAAIANHVWTRMFGFWFNVWAHEFSIPPYLIIALIYSSANCCRLLSSLQLGIVNICLVQCHGLYYVGN